METKINFFKKIYFSIFKINQYGILIKNGVKKSAYYVMDLIVICSIIYASILTFQMKSNASKLKEYLEQNFPNLTYENNQITSEIQERVILDDKLVEANFGGQIVIDTLVDYEILIEEFKKTEKPTILFTADKYVTIGSRGNTQEYEYSELIGQNSKDKVVIGKEYFINKLNNISYIYYFFGYLLGSCIGTSILIFLYNLLITIFIFVFCKIKKLKVKFSEIYSMGLYAHTISIWGYFIINFAPASATIYIQILTFLVPIIYLMYAVYINKWKMLEEL